MLFDNDDVLPANFEEVLDEKEAKTNELLILKEKYLLLAADFENYKKRIDKEKKNWINFAKMDSLQNFFPFLDEMALAIKSLEEQAKENDILQKGIIGFSLIFQNYQKKLFDLGVIETSYDEFDPEFHEAIGFVENLNLSNGKIDKIVKRGFLFENQVLRYAQVIVVKNNN